MKEYDAQEINTEVCLDGYERERRLQSAELRGTSNQPPASPIVAQSNDAETTRQAKLPNMPHTDPRTEEESSLFDILQEDDTDNNNGDEDANIDPTVDQKQ